MSKTEFIKIESKHALEKVKIGDFALWQALRFPVRLAWVNKNLKKKKSTKTLSPFQKLKILWRNSLLGNKSLKESYDYIFISSHLNETTINNKPGDKFGNEILSKFENRVLWIQDPGFDKFHSFNENPVSNTHTFFRKHILSFVWQVIKSKFWKIENQSILLDALEEFSVNPSIKKKLINFFFLEKQFYKLFKKKKIKALFVVCYMGISHQAAIKAAKRLSIPVIELQHGIINKAHEGYQLDNNIGKNSFPDYLFSFNKKVKDIISPNIILKNNIFPVGYNFIEYAKNSYYNDPNLINHFEELKKKYQKLIAITSQFTVEDDLISLINLSAKQMPDFGFIFIPRTYEPNFDTRFASTNIILGPNYTFYKTVGFCDIHSTVYSTCALEAPYFGVPNILINLNNLSRIHLEEYFKEAKDLVLYADNQDAYVHLLKTWSGPEAEKLEELSDQFYLKDYSKNLHEALVKLNLL